MNRVLAIAPHPDDETLGCGGTLLRHKALGGSIHWLIVTAMDPKRFTDEEREHRRSELERVAKVYDFDSVVTLGLPTARLETLPMDELVAGIGQAVASIEPDTIYVPFPGDAHTDHRAVYTASAAATKWFRYPSVKRVLACEILSETDFALNPSSLAFCPNSYTDISQWLERKLDIMRMYAGEMGDHPFPRSETSIRALAALRGAQCGASAAEAFMLLKEIIR